MNYSASKITNGSIVMTITPVIASEWLAKLAPNRKLSMRIAERYAEDMRHGRWAHNGESIKFDKNGYLFDGQHRLHAIILADCPIISDVRFGLERGPVDQGKRRTFGDELTMRHEASAIGLAAGVKIVALYEHGKLGLRASLWQPSWNDLVDCLRRHPRIRESLTMVPKVRLLPPSLSIGLHYLFSCVDQDRANIFFNLLSTGESLALDSPIRRLRERLIVWRTKKAKMTPFPNETTALVIKAWNHWLAGEQLRFLRWRTRGDVPEEFPKISGLNIAVHTESDERKAEAGHMVIEGLRS